MSVRDLLPCPASEADVEPVAVVEAGYLGLVTGASTIADHAGFDDHRMGRPSIAGRVAEAVA